MYFRWRVTTRKMTAAFFRFTMTMPANGSAREAAEEEKTQSCKFMIIPDEMNILEKI